MTASSASVALPSPQTDGLYKVMMVCTGNICRSAMAKVVLRDRLAAIGAASGTAVEGGVPVAGSSGWRGGGSGGAASREHGRSGAASQQAASGGPDAFESSGPQRIASRRAPVVGTSIVVLSAGTSDEEYGNPIDPRARRVLAEAGYTSLTATEAVETHYAHRISDDEILGNDLLLAMTAHHYRELLRRGARLGADPSRVIMYRALDPEASSALGDVPTPGAPAGPGAVPDLPDPWYGTMEDFVDTLQVVERVSDALVTQLRRWA